MHAVMVYFGIFWCICDRNMKVADISGNHFYQRGE